MAATLTAGATGSSRPAPCPPLRRRPLLRFCDRAAPRRPHRRHRCHPGWPGLLARGIGRRVFHYGDAHFYGSATVGLHSDHTVAIAATPDGRATGSFPPVDGSPLRRRRVPRFGVVGGPEEPVVAAAPTPDGKGYWLLPSIPPPVGLRPRQRLPRWPCHGDRRLGDARRAARLEADIPGIDVEAAVSRQWDAGIALVQQLKFEGRLGAIVVIDLGTNGR